MHDAAARPRRRRCRRARARCGPRPPGRSRRRRAAAAASFGSSGATVRARCCRRRAQRPSSTRSSSMREGEHVGRAVVAHEPLVELGHRGLVDEEDRQLGVARARPRRSAPTRRACDPAGDVDRVVVLLVGDEDLDVALTGAAAALRRRGDGADHDRFPERGRPSRLRSGSGALTRRLPRCARRRRRCPARCGGAPRRGS